MTINSPGKSAARFGHHESEIFGVSDDVRPGGRRPLSFAKRRYIFATAMYEAANTVEKRDLGLSQRRLGKTLGARSRLKWWRRWFFRRSPRELILKRSSFADDHHSRHGMKQDALFLWHHVCAPDKDASRSIQQS